MPIKDNVIKQHIKMIIFQIDQKVEKDWPLTLIDNEGQKKKILLKPGEMLIYEGAKVPHGRQFPLEGEYYENILVHFGLMDATTKSHKSSVKII